MEERTLSGQAPAEAMGKRRDLGGLQGTLKADLLCASFSIAILLLSSILLRCSCVKQTAPLPDESSISPAVQRSQLASAKMT